MTQAAPPVGYAVDAGAAWTTDIDHDTTRYKTGDSAVLFKDTTPASDPHLYQDVATPCAAGDLFRISGWVNANRRNSGDNVQLYAAFYDAAGAGVSTTTVFEDVVSTVDTWELKSGVVAAPSGAYGVRPIFGKNNVAFKCWWDSVFVENVEPAFFAMKAANTAMPSGSTINFTNDSAAYGAPTYDNGSNYDTGTYTFTCPKPGIYQFSFGVFCGSGLLAGEYMCCRFYVKHGAASLAVDGYGSCVRAHANGDDGASVGSMGPVWMDIGDTVAVYLYTNHSGNITIYGNASIPYSYFCGGLIR